MSSWKDTVMRPEEASQYIVMGDDYDDDTEQLLEAQAEITGKIMYKEGYDKALGQLAGMTEECKQMGRQEVVEWMRDNCKEDDLVDSWDDTYTVECRNSYNLRAFRAKLKEWGIDAKAL